MTDLPAPTAPDPLARRADVVRRAATAWSGQIVDLGGRNTLLFYKDLKVGTIDLTPSTTTDPPATATPAIDPAIIDALLDGHVTRLSRIVPPDALPEYARRARTVKAKAADNFEERGLHTLFLTYGMATWTHARSDALPAAPVLLVPLRLSPRTGVAEDFDLDVEGDWEVNPTLLHLLRTDFNVTATSDQLLGELDDLDGALRLLTERCHEVTGFAIAPRVVVGNFSYAKQPMALDIDGSIDAMIVHPVIAAIAGAEDAQRALLDRQPVVEATLPDTTPPADEFLILDADASQSYVINAAVQGANLVVQGPPGTGKSQTIANLIATLAARGKSTLFVAEKRAAIEAVTGRLDKAGLQNLVMDLHGGVGSRKAVLAQVGRALDGFGTIAAIDLTAEQQRLSRARERLCAYNEELHRPRDGEHLSVFEMQSLLLGIPDDARTTRTVPKSSVDAIPWASLDPLEDAVAEWVQLGGGRIGDGFHAWDGALGRVITQHDAEQALEIAQQLNSATIPTTTRLLEQLIAECGLRPAATIAEWGGLLRLLADVATTLDQYQPAVFDLDHATVLADLEPATKGAVGRAVASMFNDRYRAAKDAVGAVSLAPRTARELREGVLAAHQQAEDWAQCNVDGGSPRRPASLDSATEALTALTTQLATLGAYVGDDGMRSSLDDARTRTAALVEDRTMLFRMPRLHELRQHLDRIGLGGVTDEIAERDLDPDTARALLRGVWLRSKLDVVSFASPIIGAFDGDAHTTTVRDFRASDVAHVRSGAQRVLRHVAEHAIRTLNEHPEQAQLVRQQAGRKRGHLALRDVLQQAPDVLIAVKPCWAMSPLVVSQLLPSDPPLFDFVIFDEASQIPPAEAIPAILRGNQLIVAGDSRQLPPTTFFATAVETATDDGGEGGDDAGLLTQDMESILDSMVTLLPPPHGSKTLGWHYRSRDERLIAFSNAQPTLYDWTMTTFPGVGIDQPIRHVAVPWRPNLPGQEESSTDEVRAVVDLVADHARTRQGETLGIIAMGIKHAERIGEAIRLERKTDPTLDQFCSNRPDEPFFVKNLERVQGDERDAIILSIGYGKNAEGKMVYRFGPLLQQGGERRLNVAITRARRRVTVVSSFGPDDLEDGKLRSEGAQMLKRYLTYAASAGTDLGAVAIARPALNPFEADMQRRLTAAGIPVTAQLGASGHWIDIAAAHPDIADRHVLAIEADGAGYHSSATARDRDRLRQDHLERLGWSFHRVWSTDWFNHRDREVERAVAAWNAAVERSDAAVRADAAAARVTPAVIPPPPGAVGAVVSGAAVSGATGTPLEPPAGAAWSSLPPPNGPPSQPAGPPRTAPRPVIDVGELITSYSTAQLDQLIDWIRSDTLLRTDDELLDIAIDELGYRRRGARIVEALQAAIARTRPA